MLFPRIKTFLMAAAAAIYSLSALVLVYFLVAFALCIIRVPDSHAAFLYVTVFEGSMALAVSAMIVAFSESVIQRIIVWFAYSHQGRNELETAMTLFFTRAAQEIDADISNNSAVHTLKMDMGTKLKEMLESQMHNQSALYARVNAIQTRINELTVANAASSASNMNQPVSVRANACVDEISPVVAVTTVKMECGGDASPQMVSSACSAASTE